MKITRLFAMGFVWGLIVTGHANGASTALAIDSHTATHKAALARVPFIANQGQIDNPAVGYYARLFTGTLFVTRDNRLVYSLAGHRAATSAGEGPSARWVFRESFVGGQESHPTAAEPSAIRLSQYKGDSPAAWRHRLAGYDRVELGEVYLGIRVALRASGGNVEKLFYLAPGARVEDIRVVVDGVQGLAVDEKSRLLLNTGLGDIAFTAPLAYQQIDGERRQVAVNYVLADGAYGFALGAYDPTRELVIDPLLASTFIGGANPNPPGNYDDDIVHSMLVTDDAIYLAGATQSPDFPVLLGYDDSLGSSYPDGFITRMSRDLSRVLSSTYVGTQYFDRVQAIALDADGSIVATGQAGYGFPVTPGAYTYSGGTPVGGGFVARFSADLSSLLASAVVTPSDYPRELALGNGGIYFGGRTNNPGFPITSNAYLDTCCPAGGFGIREYDGFAGKVSSDLSSLQAMTYLGGDLVSGISVAPDGSVYISDGFDSAVTGYIARFDADLSTRLAYLSYYPGSTSGSSRTYFNDVVAGDGFVVTAGQTYMNDLPATAGAFDTGCGTDGVCDGIGSLLVPRPDGFIARYSADLQTTQALTYLGGSDGESIRALALAQDGSAVVTGETISVDFPTTADAFDRDCGSDGRCDPGGTYDTPAADGFVARLSADLSRLEYASYLGGSGEDRPYTLALVDAANVYVAGNTPSADFPTTANAFDGSYNGGTSDAFVSLFDTGGTSSGGGGGGSGGGSTDNLTPIADAGADRTVAPRRRVALDGRASSDPDGTLVGYAWTQVSGRSVRLRNAGNPVAGFFSPFVRRGQSETLVFELQVTDDQGAGDADRVSVLVTR